MIPTLCSRGPFHQMEYPRSKSIMNPIHTSVWIINAGCAIRALHSFNFKNSSSYGHHYHIDHCSCHCLQILLSTTKSREHSWRIIQTWRRKIMLSDQGSRISTDSFVRYSFADRDKRRGPLRETIYFTLVGCLSRVLQDK